jgi:hypothetical protein
MATTENLSTLKIHKLTQEQYDREATNGTLEDNAIYLTPDEGADMDGYMTATNPTGTGSFSMNIIAGVTVGDYSHTEGTANVAAGYASHAEGGGTRAFGYYSHAEGCNTWAENYCSHAEGYETQALGEASHAEGGNDGEYTDFTISGDANSTTYTAFNADPQTSFIPGDIIYCNGVYACVLSVNYIDSTSSSITVNTTLSPDYGLYDERASRQGGGIAWGEYSHVEGRGSMASGSFSHAEGCSTVAIGLASHAAGCCTVAANDSQYVIGDWNKIMTDDSSIFIIGGGNSSWDRSNAFRVTRTGHAYGLSSFHSSGADYAEYFEWQDWNLDDEDRRGYFVTLDGEKIKIAEPNDYILGIVSALPAVIGNGDEDWRGRYVLDDFGAFITEEFEYEVEIPEKIQEEVIDEDTGETKVVTNIIKKTVTKTGTKYKENPDYDPSIPYIQREDRPEWDAVGMMGVLAVRDDGTCQVNGYCKVAEGGIATASESGYRVIKRVNDNIIKIVFR